jgi:hypothetical protein
MAELVLRLRVDPVTGRRELVIDYASDADALPMEHEEEHRRLAGRVLDGGLGNANLAVTRAAETVPAGETPRSTNDLVATPTATKR